MLNNLKTYNLALRDIARDEGPMLVLATIAASLAALTVAAICAVVNVSLCLIRYVVTFPFAVVILPHAILRFIKRVDLIVDDIEIVKNSAGTPAEPAAPQETQKHRDTRYDSPEVFPGQYEAFIDGFYGEK